MKKIILFCIILFFLPILSACSKNIDRSFSTKEPCELPCWYGLRLDESSKQDVIDTLHSLDFIEKSEIKEYQNIGSTSDNYDQITFTCTSTFQSEPCGTIEFHEDMLYAIVYDLKYQVTIKDAIDLYGDPEYYLVQTPLNEAGGCLISFVWENNFMLQSFDMYGSSKCDRLLSPEKPDSRLVLSTVEIIKSTDIDIQTNLTTRFDWNGILQ
jgi:hypothetical protein